MKSLFVIISLMVPVLGQAEIDRDPTSVQSVIRKAEVNYDKCLKSEADMVCALAEIQVTVPPFGKENSFEALGDALDACLAKAGMDAKKCIGEVVKPRISAAATSTEPANPPSTEVE